uniref:Uncharacterized protein n=1 Tax=Rhizophora mucronata TaxID=61149 RepID=A0A2P2NH10_RHIMU
MKAFLRFFSSCFLMVISLGMNVK